ncbi:MAG: hypothetical protein KF901_21510 [Myxococcales bacterium]|nr:hypothetical protein [Myxococcales bacterium]
MRARAFGIALALLASSAAAQEAEPWPSPADPPAQAPTDAPDPSVTQTASPQNQAQTQAQASPQQTSPQPAPQPAPRQSSPAPHAHPATGVQGTAANAPRERGLAQTGEPTAPPAAEEKENWGVVYLEALGGYSFANLVQFSQENFVPEATQLNGSGIFGGIAAGLRIYWLTLGARATIARYFGFDLGTVGADLAIHLPIPVVRPYVRVGFGYGWLGDADFSDPALSETRVYGFAVDAGLGLKIKLGRLFSLGGGFDAAFLNMTRQALTGEEVRDVTGVNIREDGDAVGLQLRVHVHLTLHI